MTRCSGVKKDSCSDPCTWIVKKGCTKPDSVKAAEAAAKAAAKTAKLAAAKAAKVRAAVAKTSAKAAKADKEAKVKVVKAVKAVKEVKAAKEKVVKADKAVKEAKVKVAKAVKKVKEVKVKEAVEKVKKTKDASPMCKWSWKQDPTFKQIKFSLKLDLPATAYTRYFLQYDGVAVTKIQKHAMHVIENMFAKSNYIRQCCRGLFYIPSTETFVALIRTRSTKSPKINKNNDYLGVEFTYDNSRKYKISVSKSTIVLVEDFVGKLDKTSDLPLKALKVEYKDAIQVYDSI